MASLHSPQRRKVPNASSVKDGGAWGRKERILAIPKSCPAWEVCGLRVIGGGGANGDGGSKRKGN